MDIKSLFKDFMEISPWILQLKDSGDVHTCHMKLTNSLAKNIHKQKN